MEANYVHKDSTTLIQDKLVKNELSWFMNKPVIKHKIELYLEEEK